MTVETKEIALTMAASANMRREPKHADPPYIEAEAPALDLKRAQAINLFLFLLFPLFPLYIFTLLLLLIFPLH